MINQLNNIYSYRRNHFYNLSKKLKTTTTVDRNQVCSCNLLLRTRCESFVKKDSYYSGGGEALLDLERLRDRLLLFERDRLRLFDLSLSRPPERDL